jgi:hypothetical protein
MSESQLFWLGFIGGILRIFGVLMLLLTAYLALGVWGQADRRGILPLLIALALSLTVYFIGKKLENISPK